MITIWIDDEPHTMTTPVTVADVLKIADIQEGYVYRVVGNRTGWRYIVGEIDAKDGDRFVTVYMGGTGDA